MRYADARPSIHRQACAYFCMSRATGDSGSHAVDRIDEAVETYPEPIQNVGPRLLNRFTPGAFAPDSLILWFSVTPCSAISSSSRIPATIRFVNKLVCFGYGCQAAMPDRFCFSRHPQATSSNQLAPRKLNSEPSVRRSMLPRVSSFRKGARRSPFRGRAPRAREC
jgi:hypothetical protein